MPSGFFTTSANDLPPPQTDTAFAAETFLSNSGVDERLDFSSVLQSSVEMPVDAVDADLVELALSFGLVAGSSFLLFFVYPDNF